MKLPHFLLLVLLLAALAAFVGLDLDRFLTLDFVQSQHDNLRAFQAAHPGQAAAIYFAIYVAVASLSLPGAALLTLLGGALFGLLYGTVLVSVASTLGATAAFLASRYLLRDVVTHRFGNRLKPINAGIEREGPFYLFALRLVPVFPFFVVNLLMGITPMRTWTFMWVSQTGMLLGTAAYVNAGRQLADIHSLHGILSPGLLGSLAVLGLVPLLARGALAWVKRRRLYARWTRPAHYDRNLVVIGAGSAGLVTAYIAAAVQAKVSLVEKHAMGGDCLNTGCVPSKALIRSAKLLHQIGRAREFGLASASADWNFADVMERVQDVIAQIAPHDSVERYSRMGVDCLYGTALIRSPWEVEVSMPHGEKRVLTTKSIVIATGARPLIPPIPGLAAVAPLTSDTLWELRKLPTRLLVLGGGPIGTELAQCFARLGSKVTQVEAGPWLLSREDPDVSAFVKQRLMADGVHVLTDHLAREVLVENGEKYLVVAHGSQEVRLPFDEILCAVGRVANLEGLGLEALRIVVNRVIETNPFMETNFPNIFACGDVTGPYQFTHTAAHAAWYATVNALFGRFRKFAVDYSVVPWTTFTDPEVARVGLNEQEAHARGIAYDVYSYGLDDLDRAIADGAAHGFVKVITPVGLDKVLGATIVGEHAAELLIEFVAAMKHGFGLNAILSTIHTYPTFSEANKHVAGVYKRSTATAPKLALAAAYHDWMRGAGNLGRLTRRVWELASSARKDREPVRAPLP